MEILSEFEIWMFLAGLGMFLFGMHIMEESIRLLSGSAFKSLIRKYTGTRIRAITSGITSTAILQSSSAVSLMVLAFVGAGIMSLAQAIAVMMGAKVGTTATAWIVAVFGFNMNIDVFSLPLIGIGGLGMIALARSEKYVNISKFLIAFGLLFMGLDYMKQSVDQVSQLIDPSVFFGYGIVVFALVGALMTAIMQSSSATIAIVLTMLFTGVISFSAGAAMVVGANVGTTVTVLIGSLGGLISKKQAAFSLLLFTSTTAVIALLFLPVLAWLVLNIFGFDDNFVLGLALFHTLFNVMGVLLFYPFIPRLEKFVQHYIPDHQITLSKYINRTDPSVAEAGEEALRKEIVRQMNYSAGYIGSALFREDQKKPLIYGDLERHHGDIFGYYTNLSTHLESDEQRERVDLLLRSSRNIMNSVKNLNDIRAELKGLEKEKLPGYIENYQSIKKRLQSIVSTGRTLKPESDDEISTVFDDLLAMVNNEDRQFINRCGEMISKETAKRTEITFLLMLNRVVTQSSRMLIHAMKFIESQKKIQNPKE